MFIWIRNNYRTFLWALALGIAVWVAAVTASDPDVTRSFPTNIPIEIIGQDPDLVINNEIPTSISVSLRAPSSVWTILLADKQSVRAILDLSSLSAGEHSVDVQVQVNARPVQILSVTPRSIALDMELLKTVALPIDLNISGTAAIGYQTGDIKIEPGEIVVAGAQPQVEMVKQAYISLDLDGAREDIDQAIKVEALDKNGNKVEGVTLTPDVVQVSLPVTLQGGYRDLAVKVLVNGRVAGGYRLTDISVFPPIVTVFSADPDLVNNLPGILETQPLDLNNAQENINTRVSLNLPPGVTIVGEQTVRIEAGISAIESSVTLADEAIEVIGLGNGLTANISPQAVDVILSGPLPILDTLTRQDVRVTVDLTNLAAGTHQVTPNVEVLIANVVVESVLPNTIEVIISSGTATPFPLPTPNH